MQKTSGISKSFTLGKKERLKSRKLIERVFREGKSFAVFPFRVYYLAVSGLNDPTDSNAPSSSASGHKAEFHVQAGFSASSRNFKKAVDRNRIKRLMREAYRLQKKILVQKEPSPQKAATPQKNATPQKAATPRKESFAVFFIYTGKDLPDYQTVYEKIGVTLQKLEKHFGG